MEGYVVTVNQKALFFWRNLYKKHKYLYFALKIIITPILIILLLTHKLVFNCLLFIGVNPLKE